MVENLNQGVGKCFLNSRVLKLYSHMPRLGCVSASVSGQQIKNAIPDVARPLPLSAVRLTGGPLKHAQDLDIDYLLKLEPDLGNALGGNPGEQLRDPQVVGPDAVDR